MLHASTKKLIDRLAEMTELGKLDWSEGEADSVTYATEGYSVALSAAPHELVITSKDGRELERATSEELNATAADAGGTYADIVAAMTKEATRIALGTETAISTLLAGMDEPVVEPEPAPEAVDPAPEDPVDETTVLADTSYDEAPTETPDQDVSAPSTDLEDTAETEETSEPAFADTPVNEDAPALEASEPEVEASEEETPSEEMAIAAPAAELEMPDTPTEEALPDAETETGMTEAVARLADEVNQREETNIDVASASAAGAVTAAAGLGLAAAATEEATEEVEAEPVETAPLDDAPETPAETFAAPVSAEIAPEPELETPEPDLTAAPDDVEPEAAEPETVVAADPSPDLAPAYIPFGLGEAEAETPVEDTPETETTESPAPVLETSPMDVSEPEPVETPSLVETAPVMETAPEPEVETPPSLDLTPVAAPVPEATLEPETPSEPVSTAYAETEVATDPEAETSDLEPTTELTPETVEAPPPELEPVMAAEADEPPATEPQEQTPPAPQSYSLSGIGAGFGLGALSAKTEASGIPGPSAGTSAESEKIVIDATEDVLPEIEGNINLPLVEKVTAAVRDAAPETPEEASSEDEGSDILKPRTRFNPWD